MRVTPCKFQGRFHAPKTNGDLSMSNRPVRFRGTEYPVIERFRIGRRDYLAVAKIGSVGRRAYKVYDPAVRQMSLARVVGI